MGIDKSIIMNPGDLPEWHGGPRSVAPVLMHTHAAEGVAAGLVMSPQHSTYAGAPPLDLRAHAFQPNAEPQPPKEVGDLPPRPVSHMREISAWHDNPPRYAVEQIAPMLVAAPNSNALSEPVPASPPYVEPSQLRDDFAEAAAESASEPEPAVEAAFEGQSAVVAKGTVRPKKATIRAKGKPERRLVIRDKKQVIQYSNIIIVALQEALDHDPARHHNQPKPALYIDDDRYKDDIRELIGELRRLNELLERKSLRAAKKPAINLAKHLDKFIGTYGNTLAKDAAHLTAGVIAALLYQMGIGPGVVGHILGRLK